MVVDVLLVTYGDDTYVKLLKENEDVNKVVKDIVLDSLPLYDALEDMDAKAFVDDLLYNDGQQLLRVIGDSPFMYDKLINFSMHVVRASTDNYTSV